MTSPRITFLLSGQGSQHFQMGRELYERHPVFNYWMREGDRLLREREGYGFLETLYDAGRKKSDPFDDLALTSPALYTTEYALAQTLAHHGIVPQRLIGFSLGEFAALAIARAVTFEQGLRAVSHQPALFADCPPGRMIGILAGADSVAASITAPYEVVAVNGPQHCVIATAVEHVPEVVRGLEGARLLHQVLPVPLAFHSRWIDPARRAFAERFAGLQIALPQVEVWGGRNVAWQEGEGAAQLWDAVRAPMDLPAAVARAEAAGPSLFIDIGPSGTMAGLVRKLLNPSSLSQAHPIFSPFGNEEKALQRLLQLIHTASPV
ncbi:MAG: acyltransferase domain-containing protein [Verrucomicrobiota bacterium JB022]|nr:acyltransferase domain-containing protein [Verrucomicrobiota bacterium JB022]